MVGNLLVKVSVIVPTFNRGYLIEKVLNNLSLQTWKDFEVIVIDDGSTDNTEKILKKWCSKNSNFRYIKFDTNRGASFARNAGILESDSEYIAFLDSDDRWHPTKLDEQMTIIENSGDDIGLVYTGYTIYEFNGRVQNKLPRLEKDAFRKLLSEGRNIILLSSVIVPRKILDDVGLFDEDLEFSHDYDLFLRIAKKYSVSFVPKQLVDYHATCSDRLSLNRKAHTISHLRVYQKFQREIELFNVRHRFFYFLAKNLILSGESDLGRSLLLKAINEKPKETRYTLFLVYSLLIKLEGFVSFSFLDTFISVFQKIEKLFRNYHYTLTEKNVEQLKKGTNHKINDNF